MTRERDYTETEEYVLFLNSVYSQWYPCQFKDKEENTFKNAEQFMMYHKFKCLEPENAYKILEIHNPRLIKQMGRNIIKYDEVKWSNIREQVVTLGNYYKFTQNPNLLDILLEHQNKTIVEASPEDKIWGIGLWENDARCLNRESWLGLNLLGISIMSARNMIQNNINPKILEELIYK